MAKLSAGILMFRRPGGGLEVLLAHPGGPLWARKDLGAWSLPKGEYPEGADAFAAARREFEEETGIRPAGEFIPLGQVRQPSGKLVTAWALEGDCNPAAITSNSFSMEWPRGSGTVREYPEVDRAGWFTLPEARRKLLPGQVEFLDRLLKHLGRD